MVQLWDSWKLVQWKTFFMRAYVKFSSCFLHFSSGLDKICYRICPQESIQWSWFSWKLVQDVNELMSFTVHIFCLFWVKFGMRDLNVMPVSMCKFHENWCREGHTFHMGVMKSHLHMCCKNVWYLESTLSCNTQFCRLVTFLQQLSFYFWIFIISSLFVWNTLNSSLSILLEHCQSMNVYCCLLP